MLLAIDVGNTNMVFGLYDGDKPKLHFSSPVRLTNGKKRSIIRIVQQPNALNRT